VTGSNSHGLELRIPPLVLLVATAAVMKIVDALVPPWRFVLAGHGVIAAGCIAIAAWISVAGVREFRRASTTVNPLTPSVSSSLVTTGVYRRTRNPMYVGFAVGLLGWGIWLGNLAALLGVPLFVAYLTRFQISPEERALRASFGSEFEAYCARVRRWL
jgi:protein-S-isoprenylcysteine O-methyltransferase Ste14